MAFATVFLGVLFVLLEVLLDFGVCLVVVLISDSPVRVREATSTGLVVERVVSRGAEVPGADEIGVELAGGWSTFAITGGSSTGVTERVPGLLHLVGSSAHFST